LELGYDRMAGRFARMALGMILSSQDDPCLRNRFPQLVEAIGAGVDLCGPAPDGSTGITPCRLLLGLCDEEWGFGTKLVLAPGGSFVTAFVDPPFVFYLQVGPHEALDPTDGLDITDWVQWGDHDRFDKERNHLRKICVPWRHRAYDFAEYHYMLLLGAMHTVKTGQATTEMNDQLNHIAAMGLIEQARSGWELTESGSAKLLTAPRLAERWQP